MSASRMAIAAALLCAVSGLLHRYIWARLVRDAAWAAPWARALTVALFALAVAVPVAPPGRCAGSRGR